MVDVRNRLEGILAGDEDAVMALMEGLLFTGASMSLVGFSTPASGGEHLFSHLLDMREAVTDRKPELHGLQVAAGIILSAACHSRLASLGQTDLPKNAKAVFEKDAAGIEGVWVEWRPRWKNASF